MTFIATVCESVAGISWARVPLIIPLVFGLRYLYIIYLHPLHKIPGPWFTKFSSIWFHYHTFIGDQATAIHKLHEEYGPIVQVNPEDIDISDGEALWPIYVKNGGFEKSKFYENFDLEGHASIFSTLTRAKRSSRAKAVLPIFSASALREGAGIFTTYTEALIERIRESQSGPPINLLELTRSYALDALSAYLFNVHYGALAEHSSRCSATPLIDGIVSMAKLIYLPHSMFVLQERILDFITPDYETKKAMEKVSRFLRDMVEDTKIGGPSYQSRLLSNGVSKDETVVECLDIFFAATQSTAANLQFICWNLVSYPEVHSRLQAEIQENEAVNADLQSLPYLTGVVKEGLRLSMTNRISFPRVVPPGGWTFDEHYIPGGTNVGVASRELHFNPRTFAEPERFLPERWLEPTAEMHRDWVPFGKGARGCIARNLALTELFIATEKIVASDVLRGAKTNTSRIRVMEYFNSKYGGDDIEFSWPGKSP